MATTNLLKWCKKFLSHIGFVAKKISLHNVYFVKYDVTVSFLAQVLDTVTYFVSHVLDSGYSDIFWHIL